MTAGYSAKPLAAKLGVDEKCRCLVVGPAPALVVAQLFQPHRRAGRLPYDVIVAFNPDLATLQRHAASLPARLAPKGGLWLAWQKKASGVITDAGETEVHRLGLETGLVDVKVAAIDEVWSGLRFVHRRTPR